MSQISPQRDFDKPRRTSRFCSAAFTDGRPAVSRQDSCDSLPSSIRRKLPSSRCRSVSVGLSISTAGSTDGACAFGLSSPASAASSKSMAATISTRPSTFLFDRITASAPSSNLTWAMALRLSLSTKRLIFIRQSFRCSSSPLAPVSSAVLLQARLTTANCGYDLDGFTGGNFFIGKRVETGHPAAQQPRKE